MRHLAALLLIPFFISSSMFPPDMIATPPCTGEPPALNRFQIRDLWKQNNKRWFGERVPELKPDNILYRNLDVFLATVTCNQNPTLTISTRIQFSDMMIRQALLHEMVHVATMDCVHGPKFQLEMKRLVRAGAFDDFL